MALEANMFVEYKLISLIQKVVTETDSCIHFHQIQKSWKCDKAFSKKVEHHQTTNWVQDSEQRHPFDWTSRNASSFFDVSFDTGCCWPFPQCHLHCCDSDKWSFNFQFWLHVVMQKNCLLPFLVLPCMLSFQNFFFPIPPSVCLPSSVMKMATKCVIINWWLFKITKCCFWIFEKHKVSCIQLLCCSSQSQVRCCSALGGDRFLDLTGWKQQVNGKNLQLD